MKCSLESLGGIFADPEESPDPLYQRELVFTREDQGLSPITRTRI